MFLLVSVCPFILCPFTGTVQNRYLHVLRCQKPKNRTIIIVEFKTPVLPDWRCSRSGAQLHHCYTSYDAAVKCQRMSLGTESCLRDKAHIIPFSEQRDSAAWRKHCTTRKAGRVVKDAHPRVGAYVCVRERKDALGRGTIGLKQTEAVSLWVSSLALLLYHIGYIHLSLCSLNIHFPHVFQSESQSNKRNYLIFLLFWVGLI